MATSGTIANTVIDNSALMEHAFRRCRVLPSAQTPETVLIAQECLYMLLLNMSNRGLNLWCIEKEFIGLTAGKETYVTPPGTLDLLNVIYSQPTLSPVSFSAETLGGRATLTSAATTLRVGFKVASAFTGALTISDVTGVLFTLPISDYVPGVYYWADMPVASTASWIQVDGVVMTDVVLAASIYDLPMTPWNRDTYAAINNKRQQAHPSTNYFFEKKLNPTVTVWPVPDNEIYHITIYRHRQPQDVGSLTQQLEIPARWLDGFIWLLAARFVFELPSVDPAVGQMVIAMADKQVFEAEGGESDGMPTFLTPNISVYSR